MIALIDGDSIPFMLGWHHKDHQDKEVMFQAVDKFLEDMFILTGATMYYGAIGTDHKCFRYSSYKVKPYKGTRPELPDYMQYWRPVVKEYLQKQWKFEEAFLSGTDTSYPDYLSGTHRVLEADDLIGTAATEMLNAGHTCIVCSPDKDLRQLPGTHYDYRDGKTYLVRTCDAHYNFFTLMLQGDTVDGVCGIPGFGPVKAQKYLKPLLESQEEKRSVYEELVKSLYHKHFGSYYGDIIYTETEKAISLVYDQERKIEVHSVPTRKEAHPFDQ